MEPRYRTILPVVGILLVLIVALFAFFITRRIRNTNTAKVSPSATAVSVDSSDLIVPKSTGNTSTTARPTVRPINRQPQTGPEDEQYVMQTTTLDEQGFREAKVTVVAGTKLIWLNMGATPQTITINGLSSGSIAAGQTFSYVFDGSNKQVTVKAIGHSSTQTITVQ